MASPILSPPPVVTPLQQQGGVAQTAWAKWFQNLQSIVQGSQQLPYASYSTAAGQSIPTAALTVVNFDTLEFDTDNAVTTGAAWTFTVPAAKGGLYHASFVISIVSGATTAVYVSLLKNGVEYKRFAGEAAVKNTNYQVGSIVMSLAGGDTIAAAIHHAAGVNEPLESLALSNWITIAGLRLA